jgi:hypothetical protein
MAWNLAASVDRGELVVSGCLASPMRVVVRGPLDDVAATSSPVAEACWSAIIDRAVDAGLADHRVGHPGRRSTRLRFVAYCRGRVTVLSTDSVQSQPRGVRLSDQAGVGPVSGSIGGGSLVAYRTVCQGLTPPADYVSLCRCGAVDDARCHLPALRTRCLRCPRRRIIGSIRTY